MELVITALRLIPPNKFRKSTIWLGVFLYLFRRDETTRSWQVNALAILIGGAIESLLRYSVNTWRAFTTFHLGTLLKNINACFLAVQYKTLVKDHLDQALEFQSRGIKVLSLRSLDRVENYHQCFSIEYLV